MTLLSSRAIVLHRTPYNDRNAIVHLYTEQYGRLGVLVPNGRSKRNRQNLKLLPLSEIDFTADLRTGRQLASLKEVQIISPHYASQASPSKASQGIFISELLYRILTHTEPDSELYHYIAHALDILEQIERGVANFYICFTFHLLRHLAIAPSILRSTSEHTALWYDLEEASFCLTPRDTRHALPPHEAQHLKLFARISFTNMHVWQYSRDQRGMIIDRLLQYYRLHLPPFPAIRSLEILRSVQTSLLNQRELEN